MVTLSACGVLCDGAPWADGFFGEKNSQKIELRYFLWLKCRHSDDEARLRSAIREKTGAIAFLCDVHLVVIGKK
jgi:hypothetical protein